MKQTLLSFLLMFLPMLANAAIEIDGIYYNLDTDAKTAEVTRLNRNQKYSGDVMIPSSVTYEEIDYCVTSIARQAFYNCSELTSVTIPNSMTSIGNEAFRNCSNLTKVELNSNAMVSKDYDAGSSINEIFGSQVKEYVLGDEVTGIGNYAFFGCSNLISVHMSDYVTTIGEGAFSQCYQLTSFEMPNNVESIGTLAFNMCYSLTAITIPTSLTNLDYWTFPGCSGLTKVELNSNAIVSKDFGTSLGSYFGGQVEEYVLGEEVTSIGKRAFAGCYGLTSIVIPSNLTSIGDDAFQNCSALTSISIPSNLTSIGDNAFYNCNGLLSIQVENGNLVYDSRENCNAIIKTADNTIILGCQNTIIPNSVTIIGDNAFYSCADLTSISIPTGVEIIGDCAFCGCKGLTTIDIPNSVTSIGKYAFASCEGLTSVTIPNGVTTIDEYAFAWCI